MIHKLYHLFIVAAISLVLTGCSKNEFTIDFKFSDSGTQNLRIVYLASTSKESILVDQTLPVVNGALQLKGVTRYPTMVYVFSPSGTLLNAIYAQKGDNIAVTGNISDPLGWKASGNDVSEQYSAWVAANAAAMRGGGPQALNAMISKYFAGKHNDQVAALLLFNLFSERDDKAEFDRLLASLPKSEELEQLRKATMSVADSNDRRAEKITVTPIQLYSADDSLAAIRPADHKLTVMYFWHDAPDPDAMRKLMAAAEGNDIAVADICMNSDTAAWKHNLHMSSVVHPNSYWALGGTANGALNRLAIPRLPYFILTDSHGKQLYRGDNLNQLSSKLRN